MSETAAHFTLTFENLKAWCARQNYQFRTNDQAGQLAVDYTILGQPSPLVILPQPARGMVMMVMRQPYLVPAERRAAVLDAANRLNVTSFMGAWALNGETGELFFRASVVALENQYTDEGFLHAARVVVGTSEKAAPALKSIALDGADPEATIKAIALPS